MVMRYIIIGTDTSCGKTFVTCQFSAYFKKWGQKVLAIKPVASGCRWQNGLLVNDDIIQLQAVNGDFKGSICRWQFEPPVSPHIAAAEIGDTITAEEIISFCHNPMFSQTPFVLIETAGGLMSPLNQRESWIDVLEMSQIPAILVVGMRLGCLNHALLTAKVLQQHDIECVGWVANSLDPSMERLDENIQTLEAALPWPLLMRIAYQNE